MPDLLDSEIIAEYREYLICLVRPKIPYDLRGKIDPSDVVQETLLDAIRDLAKHQGQTKAEMIGWLKQILQFNLVDRFRKLKKEPTPPYFGNDDGFEKTSEGFLEFARLSQSEPLRRSISEEDAVEGAVLIAGMLGQLSEAQAEAVVLKHCEGMRVDEISRHMNRTPESVGGLLRHGMNRLRALMPRED